MTFSADIINEIIGLKDVEGKQIDIFNLYAVVVLSNRKASCSYRSDDICIDLEDFRWCETRDQVQDQFAVSAKDAISGLL